MPLALFRTVPLDNPPTASVTVILFVILRTSTPLTVTVPPKGFKAISD